MRKQFAVLALSVVALGGIAGAAEVKGTVETINTQTRTLTLGGIAYVFPEEVGLVHLLPGDAVILTFNATATGNVVEKVAR